LYSADFRAAEKLYAQLVQVAGRAGRADKPGEVLVQTAFPNHPLFQALISQDYDSWAQSLLHERKMAGFPPYVFQAMLRAEGRQPNKVFTFLNRARDAAKSLAQKVEIYDVVPASMAKRAQHTRAQLLVQSESRKALQIFLRAWRPSLVELASAQFRWSLDIDPLEF
jgi:primosomal protein N' (replication factor Y)